MNDDVLYIGAEVTPSDVAEWCDTTGVEAYAEALERSSAKDGFVALRDTTCLFRFRWR